MKKICVINTGGTLSMRRSESGYRPSPGYLANQMANMDELSQAPMPEFDLIEYEPLVDSSNMTPDIWRKIANDIQERHDAYDGFVVLHGTDTMAYSAAALAFMLDGLSKPVIFTGAQLPLGQIRNDARENLKTAMVLAANYQIPEVGLLFGDHLFRGCRSTKVSATRFDAFDSPNYPPLATVGTSIEIFEENFLSSESRLGSLQVNPIEATEVAAFRLFPGMSIDILHHLLQRPLKGIILETFGDGNGPTESRFFLEAISSATQAGMVILGCTQCLHGEMTQGSYATGTALTEAGVIPGRDMTIEAALTKMQFLFSQNFSVDEIRAKIGQNLVGEISTITD
ncbi:asparaginase [Mariniblastus sp.]|nr:asparaginase [Mariniblastus sp.]MDA7902725.1 asparaginase [Mariniblastus sp.]MDC3223480.1 asparaginase [Mariniblastus sp.]